MTFIKPILLTLLLGSIAYSAVKVPDTVVPAGEFPSHIANYGLGGWHSTTNHLSIPAYLLVDGTAAYNTETGLGYVYSTNTSAWVDLATVPDMSSKVDTDGSNTETNFAYNAGLQDAATAATDAELAATSNALETAYTTADTVVSNAFAAELAATSNALETAYTDADTVVSNAFVAALGTHTNDTANPHTVTAAQVGLGSADNTSDADKPVSTAQQTALDLKQDAATAATDAELAATSNALETAYIAADALKAATNALLTAFSSGASTSNQVATSDGSSNITWTTLPSGVTDHGALTGLGDDDHSHYHTDARGDERYLYRENTSAFTPDADYEPATKKYVDDTATAAAGTRPTRHVSNFYGAITKQGGTGTVSGGGLGVYLNSGAGTSTNDYVKMYFINYSPGFNTACHDWDKEISFGLYFHVYGSTGDVVRIWCGDCPTGDDNVIDPVRESIGFEIEGNTLGAIMHDGTSVSTVASTNALFVSGASYVSSSIRYAYYVYVEGSTGTYTWYVNGTQFASTSSGPAGVSGSAYSYVAFLLKGNTGASNAMQIAPIHIDLTGEL